MRHFFLKTISDKKLYQINFFNRCSDKGTGGIPYLLYFLHNGKFLTISSSIFPDSFYQIEPSGPMR